MTHTPLPAALSSSDNAAAENLDRYLELAWEICAEPTPNDIDMLPALRLPDAR